MTTVTDLTPTDYRGLLEGPLFRGFSERLTDQGALEDHLAEKVPGVSLPKPEAARAGNSGIRLNFGFGFGLGGGGGGSRGGNGGSPRPAPEPQQPIGY